MIFFYLWFFFCLWFFIFWPSFYICTRIAIRSNAIKEVIDRLHSNCWLVLDPVRGPSLSLLMVLWSLEVRGPMCENRWPISYSIVDGQYRRSTDGNRAIFTVNEDGRCRRNPARRARRRALTHRSIEMRQSEVEVLRVCRRRQQHGPDLQMSSSLYVERRLEVEDGLQTVDAQSDVRRIRRPEVFGESQQRNVPRILSNGGRRRRRHFLLVSFTSAKLRSHSSASFGAPWWEAPVRFLAMLTALYCFEWISCLAGLKL